MGKRGMLGVAFLLVLLFSVIGFAQALAADKYPTKHISYIINFGAGGQTDTMCRTLVKIAGKEIGVPIVPETITGASGVKGMYTLAKAKPDGYTLGHLAVGPLVLSPHTHGVPYNSLTDFTFILGYAKMMAGLITRKDAPFKTMKEMVEFARQNPGKVAIADPIPGGGLCLGLKWLEMQENIKFKWVPHNGTGPSMAALLGGHVELTVNNPPGIIPYLESGDVRMLASLSQDRNSDMKVPTFKELGWNFEWTSWAGVGTPRGLPEDVQAKIHGAFKKAIDTAEFRETMEKLQVPVEYRPGKDYERIIKEYDSIFGEVIRKTGYGK